MKGYRTCRVSSTCANAAQGGVPPVSPPAVGRSHWRRRQGPPMVLMFTITWSNLVHSFRLLLRSARDLSPRLLEMQRTTFDTSICLEKLFLNAQTYVDCSISLKSAVHIAEY